MIQEDLGYTNDLENYLREKGLDSFNTGRVILEHKERYVVKTTKNEYEAEIIGNLRYSASSRADFPAVGDWVAISCYDDNKALIHAILPRKTIIQRQSVGEKGDKQIIAANIDFALIVQAADRDFNINRLERYLTICNESGVKPIIVLNKIDLINEAGLSRLIHAVSDRISKVPLVAISNETQAGIDTLKKHIVKGKTYCLLGSSGVGKSTLVNTLAGKQFMKTNSISSSSNKGKHVTTHRELIILEGGGLLIDNPGMREVGIADSSGGLEITFETILTLAEDCKFKDCTHVSETECAVKAAVERGDVDKASYENFLKMEREKEHYESTIAERRKKDKDFGKMVKHFKKSKTNR